MPSHSSHFLQSLNINCFASLKRSYRKQIETNIQFEINYMNKLKFLILYNIVYTKVLNINNIYQRFIVINLVLYNFD